MSSARSNQSATAVIRNQILWDRLIAVVEEQAQTIIRTAFGAAAREAGDVSAGLFLPDGRMIAQAVTGTPGHVNSVAESVRHFLAEFPAPTMRPGDIYITNDPWKATGHLFDITVVTPVFLGSKLVALFASNTHVVDIGGVGVGPDATQIYHEGLFIPIAKLADRGEMSKTVLDFLRANVRDPVQVVGDVYALVSCNEVAGRRLAGMMREYGLKTLQPLGEHIIAQSHAAMLKAAAAWPAGTWHHEMTIDGYEAPIHLKAALTVSARGIEVDFTGSSGAVQRALNVPKSYTDAYTSFGVRCIIGADVPNNAGSLGAVTVKAPEGSIVNALPPCAVTSRAIVGMMLPDLVFGCLRQACPDRVPAEGASSLWNIRLVGGQPMAGAPAEDFLAGRRFTQVSFTTGGTGARPRQDGLSTTSFPSGVRNTAVEISETMAPLVFWRKEYRLDSGGPGKYRGGLGQVVEVSHAEHVPMILAATFDRIKFPARGALGGQVGAPGRVRLKSGRELNGKGRQLVPAGDRVIIETPGGGGIGEPRERAPESVERDVRHGLVGAEAARDVYGWE
ncbi:5-oxoprolinase [Bordetella genomosp. 10]|uniref:5-oxoprolinase n=1 Tax=Bordetella genomosp. 10 TaxID=1416804 RepID=A0A261SQ83_9BORD|nr:hydantoinase B/oxoprolinase family protein [Bordetella genomosp. 10]OZI38453.1 5-oxoprolinase [Bordetella genomosp. 10]